MQRAQILARTSRESFILDADYKDCYETDVNPGGLF